jgi:hypothetical protein
MNDALESAGPGGSEQGGSARSRPRMDWVPAGLALGSALAWVVMVGTQGWPRPVSAVVLGLGGIAALRRGNRDAAALALATAALAAFSALPSRVMWIWALLAVIGGLLVAYRFRLPWLRRGNMNGAIVAWIGVIIAISVGALVAWWAVFRPDLKDLTFPVWLHALHPAVIALVFLVWASLNAIAEEFYFRGGHCGCVPVDCWPPGSGMWRPTSSSC